jgi:hypothetical protein
VEVAAIDVPQRRVARTLRLRTAIACTALQTYSCDEVRSRGELGVRLLVFVLSASLLFPKAYHNSLKKKLQFLSLGQLGVGVLRSLVAVSTPARDWQRLGIGLPA